MSKPARISYVIMAVLLALVGLLHLGTLAFTTLFGYFALRQFSLGRSKALGVVIYVIAVTAIVTVVIPFAALTFLTHAGALPFAPAALVLPLVFILLPTLFASFYASYRDVFGYDAAP